MSHKWVKKWDVESRNSGKPYVVSISVDGEWGCSCPNWIFRRHKPDYKECDHITDTKIKINWDEGNTSNVMHLVACRVEKLKAKGKTERQIERDLQLTLGIGE